MNVTDRIDDQQTKLWNGVAGHAWVETEDLLNHIFRPFENLLVSAIHVGSPDRVLDVGCGTGTVSIAVARRLGAEGCCVGIDISDPMITAARLRANRDISPASFIRGNAEVHAFEPGSFDRIISRFGVMFFDDSVRAFANLRRATAENGSLQFIAWRSAEENPFMIAAERAAMPLLPGLPARRMDGPGQFAFADSRRVRHILEESGWSDIDISPVDVVCTLAEADLDRYLARLGPVGMALQDMDDRARTQILRLVRPAFDRYIQGLEVRFTAACWLVDARV